jgi:hypothetical protein
MWLLASFAAEFSWDSGNHPEQATLVVLPRKTPITLQAFFAGGYEDILDLISYVRGQPHTYELMAALCDGWSASCQDLISVVAATRP